MIRKAPEAPKRRGPGKTACPLDPNAPPIPPKPVSTHRLVQNFL